MSPLSELSALCAILFIGSMLSGYAPTACAIPPPILLMLTTVGAGLLVGTALVVIIPEGIATIYSSLGNSVNPTVVGTTMALGFVLMLILDRVAAGYGHAHSHVEHVDNSASGRSCSLGGSSAMLGLLVHNAVDGFALGVSSAASGGRDLSFIVFLAILLHKAPAALAFSTFLLQQRRTKSQVMRQLFVFCGIIPLAAFVTYFIMVGGSASNQMTIVSALSTTKQPLVNDNFVVPAHADTHARRLHHTHSDSHAHDHHEAGDSQHDASASSQMYTVGLALLFSGGTFLYVACCHILPEVMADIVEQQRHAELHSHVSDIAGEHAHGRAVSAADLPWKHVTALIVGTVLPIVLSSATHGHVH